VLPMLILGDLYAVLMFRAHAQWKYVARMLPPTALGVLLGTLFMRQIPDVYFKPLVGLVILALAIMQLVRMKYPKLYEQVPHQTWFVWTIGLLAGITTMLANAAGPVMALYFLAVALPKYELTGTSAWFFLIVNSFKVPFSIYLELIRLDTLLVNGLLVPVILIGLLLGRWCITRVSQQLFDGILLAFVMLAAVRMIVMP